MVCGLLGLALVLTVLATSSAIGLRALALGAVLLFASTLGFVLLRERRRVGFLRDLEELAHRTAMAVDHAQRHAGATEARERFARLVDGLDAIVWEANPQTFAFTFVSQRAEALLGYPVERWIDDPTFWLDVIHPDDRATAMTQFERCTQRGADGQFEFRARAADGRIVWLDNVVRVAREPDGDIGALHGFMVDVSERKRMEEERARRLASITRLALPLSRTGASCTSPTRPAGRGCTSPTRIRRARRRSSG